MSDHITFAIFLIALFFLFIVVKRYIKWKSNKREQLRRFPLQIAASNRMQLSVTDHFQNKTLGFDTFKHKILYIDVENNLVQVVDMNDVADCKLIKKQVSIQLELNYKDPSRAPLTITFYHKFRDYKWRRNKLEKKADYWELLMSQVLSGNYESVKSLAVSDFE